MISIDDNASHDVVEGDTVENFETPLVINIDFNEVAKDCDDQTNLKQLMDDFELKEILPYLSSAGITFRSLKYLSKEDIYKSIPHVGLQAEFRYKLFLWRKKKYNIDDETLSCDTKVDGWLKNCIPEHIKNPMELNPIPSPSSSIICDTPANTYAFLKANFL